MDGATQLRRLANTFPDQIAQVMFSDTLSTPYSGRHTPYADATLRATAGVSGLAQAPTTTTPQKYNSGAPKVEV